VIRGVDPKKGNNLTIFDRIGALRYTTSDYGKNWNGTTTNGEKLTPGTYYYVFTNEKESIKGFLEIRY
jgi:gliding motility-associated-like protein